MNRKQKIRWSSFRLVAQFADRYKIWIVVSVIALLMNAAADVIAGFAVKYLTDSTLNGAAPWKDSGTILGLVALVTAGVGSRLAIGVFSARFAISVVRDMRSMISRRIELMKLSDLEDQSGRMVSRMTSDMNVVQNFLQNEFTTVLYSMVVFVLAFVYLTIVNWKLSVAAVASVPLTMFLIARFSRPLKKYARNEQEGRDAIASIAQDAAGGVYMEKAYNLQGYMKNKFNQAADRVLHYSLLRQRRTSYLNPIQSILRWIPLLSVAVLGGYLALKGEMTTGGLLAFIVLLNYLVDPLSNIQDFISQVQGAAVSSERISELLLLPGEDTKGQQGAVAADERVVAFEEVSFGYSEDQQTLTGISFQIAKGESAAFVGSSGSGKSTVFKLICDFMQPNAGAVRLMGIDLKDWNLESARDQIALVSQEAFLFPGTIAENISYGRPGATLEEIVKAAKLANAHEFIVQMNEGYHSLVGERGVMLSGGQRQRLTIARAFLKNAPLLLLDEPTSALDSHSEAMVQEALKRIMKGRTTLIIAHRLSTIRNVDKIYVLHEGRIVEEGTHASLMAQKNWYMELYSKQAGLDAEQTALAGGGIV